LVLDGRGIPPGPARLRLFKTSPASSAIRERLSGLAKSDDGLSFLSREKQMEDHVYKIIELASSSNESLEDAIRKGVSRAGETLDNLRWFEVKEMRGHIENGQVAHFQVVLRIGFTLKES
jgi:dodecin